MLSLLDDDRAVLGSENSLCAHLRVVFGGLHTQDIWDDTVNLYVTDEPGKEELLHNGRAE